MDSPIQIYFIPFLARGHTIPLIDTARLFARRGGVRCTIVTTPGNASYIRGTIEKANTAEGLPIDLELVPFPSAEVGLPAGVECTDALPDGDKELLYFNLYRGMFLLRRPIEKLVDERRPDCIVSDSLLYWTTDFARSRSIPLFQFAVFSPFSKAVFEEIFSSRAVLASPGSDAVGPLTGLPHPLEVTRRELPNNVLDPQGRYFEGTRLAEDGICGIMFNSFDELSPEYDEQCRKVTLNGGPMSVWCIGPVQLYKAGQDGGGGGWDVKGGAEIKEWLDSKRPESVLYISFGSECVFSNEQLREIAVGLKGCGHSFIWVVRRGGGGAETMEEWLPEGFHETVGERGLILTEWVPQVAILNHEATGGCIVHCGWNSCMETVCAGLPVIAPTHRHTHTPTDSPLLSKTPATMSGFSRLDLVETSFWNPKLPSIFEFGEEDDDVFALDLLHHSPKPSPFELLTFFETAYDLIRDTSSSAIRKRQERTEAKLYIKSLSDRVTALESGFDRAFGPKIADLDRKYTWTSELRGTKVDRKYKWVAEAKAGEKRNYKWTAEIKGKGKDENQCKIYTFEALTSKGKSVNKEEEKKGEKKDEKKKEKGKEEEESDFGVKLVEIEEKSPGAIAIRRVFDKYQSKGKRKELSPQDAAVIIQMTFRAHLVRRSKVLRCLRDLAVAKAKLKEIRSLFYNFSYGRRIANDAEERQRFSEKIIVLLLTVDAIEGPDYMVRAARRSMVEELEYMLEVVDPHPHEKLGSLRRRKV